jgi:hypothetical protein
MTILQNILLINMSRPIWDIYLKNVRTLFCVRMLTLKLQSLSRSIPTNEVSLPAITVVSQDTLGHTVIKSGIRSLGSRNKSQWQVSLTLNLPCLIILFGKNSNIKAECFRVKPHKPKKNLISEGLVNMMKSVLVRLNNLDMAYNPASQVNKAWVRKDETIHPLRGSGLA